MLICFWNRIMARYLRSQVMVILMFVFSVVGCANNTESLSTYEMERTGKYKVLVSTGGKEVKDFNTPLVQRLTLSREYFAAVQSVQGTALDLPFQGKGHYDTRGRLRGFKVVNYRYDPRLPELVLRDGDVVTAVEKSIPRGVADFALFWGALRKNGEATYTFERNHVPHKVFLKLESD